MRQYRPFLVLAVISLIFTVLLATVIFRGMDNNAQKICQIIQIATRPAVNKPVNPSVDISRERSYERYIQFVALGKSLGCID